MTKFYRIFSCVLVAGALITSGTNHAWAKPKKPTIKAQKLKQKTKPAAHRAAKAKQKTVAPIQLDPASEFALVDAEAASLSNAVGLAPDDPAAKQKLVEVALRAVRAAERAWSRGDDTMFAAYSTLIRQRMADTQPGLESMAARGIGAADYALGAIDLHGFLAAKDVDRACARFAAAIEKGFGGAKFRHAQCIEESDPGRAYALLREAADAGHVAATERLGRICLEANPPDAPCAYSRLGRAAREGRASSMALLGWMHAEGIGGEPDPAKASHYYQEGARRGDPSAHNNLGELLETGRGIARDDVAAFEHYLAAAKGGDPQGQYNVGRLYAGGRGTSRDFDEARRWLELSAQAGITQAREILRLLDQGTR